MNRGPRALKDPEQGHVCMITNKSHSSRVRLRTQKHHYCWRLRLRPRPHWGSLRCSPRITGGKGLAVCPLALSFKLSQLRARYLLLNPGPSEPCYVTVCVSVCMSLCVSVFLCMSLCRPAWWRACQCKSKK